jgi:ribonuclease HI
MKTAPHYLLLTDTDQFENEDRATTATGHSIAPTGGRWHFVLEPIHHGVRIEADDIEPGVIGERLNLLAVVRGIEALEQPSNVTLVTPSKYVGRGIRRDIRIWKENHWQWDHFGQRVDIKHRDLWQRIDRAMQFHKIDCRIFGNRNRIHNAANQLKDLSLVHDHVSPYAAPFAENTFSNHASLRNDNAEAGSRFNTTVAVATSVNPIRRNNQTQGKHRRRIVLTNERMNDKHLALDDLSALESRHQKLFKATKTGWTRVTEIDADSPFEGEIPAAFGCSAN